MSSSNPTAAPPKEGDSYYFSPAFDKSPSDELWLASTRRTWKEVDKLRISHTPSEVEDKIQGLHDKISQAWSFLSCMLEGHEETIRRRWKNKSTAQRKSLLEAVWSRINRTHRPEFEHFRKAPSFMVGLVSEGEGSTPRAWMWPQINLEDLTKGMFLPLFINTRGRHSPQRFVSSDWSSLQSGIRMRQIGLPIIDFFCAVQFTAPVDGEYTTKIITDASVPELLKCGQAYPPEAALLIMTTQSQILNFLGSCVRNIMPEVHIYDPNHVHKEVPMPAPLVPTELQLSDMKFITTEAQYRFPGRLNFNILATIIGDRRESAEDHISSLREDPAYFRELIVDAGEHSDAHVQEYKGPRYKYDPGKTSYSHEVGYVVKSAYHQLISWDLLLKSFNKMHELYEECEKNQTDELLDRLVRSYMRFWAALTKMGEILRRNLRSVLPGSPVCRQHSFWDHKLKQARTDPVREDKDYMLRLLIELSRRQIAEYISMPEILDELENHLYNNPTEGDRLSLTLEAILQDLGLLARIAREIELFQPWSSIIKNMMKSEGARLEVWLEQLWSPGVEFIRSMGELEATALGRFHEKNLNYPSNRRLNRDNTEKLRRAEEALDGVWEAVEQHFLKRSGATLTNKYRSLFQPRAPVRTPEWVEPEKPKKQSVLGPKSPDSDLIVDTFEHMHIDTAKSAQALGANSTRTKVKTRKETGPSVEANDPNPPIAEPEPPKTPQVEVSRKAYKVFKTLFYTPSEQDQSGEIHWTDFLQAMTEAGMMPRKIWGSAWQFTLRTTNQSIQFHQPHPGKLRFVIARGIGRRLARKFGWDIEMFGLK